MAGSLGGKIGVLATFAPTIASITRELEEMMASSGASLEIVTRHVTLEDEIPRDKMNCFWVWMTVVCKFRWLALAARQKAAGLVHHL